MAGVSKGALATTKARSASSLYEAASAGMRSTQKLALDSALNGIFGGSIPSGLTK